MLKKILLILIINIVLISVIYFTFEYFIKNTQGYDLRTGLWEMQEKEFEFNPDDYEIEKKPDNFVQLEKTDESFKLFCHGKKNLYGENYKKNPIVVMGCSYAYGHGVKEEKTFSYILSEITQRPVYNFSECGYDAIRSLESVPGYLYMNRDKEDSLKKTDYVIYLYMYNHIERYLQIKSLMDLYNKVNKPSITDKLMEKLFVLNFFNMEFKRKDILEDYPSSQKSIQYQNKVLLYWYKKLKEYTPNAKVIIIIYDEKITSEYPNARIKYVSDVMNSPDWKKLEEETQGGIKVVHTKDLTGFVFDKDWKLKADITDWHPNDRVWEYFTPLFVKEYIK